MILTQQQAIERLSEKVYDNTRNIRQKDRQRRHQVTDIYGDEFTRQLDSGSPAKFYISISPDMVYLERFEFKLIIQPFVSYSNGMETVEVDVNPTSLSVGNTSLTDNNNSISPNPHNHGVTPNPHDHTTVPHTHNLTSGIAITPTTASDFRVYIEGIDVTAYLMAQYGSWIDGEGVYPSLNINEDYDILEVACDMVAEGREEDANKLTRSGYKEVMITANAPAQVTLVLYEKYSHTNR